MTATALTLLAAYLVGAIPFGYLVARWRGVDILKLGSGNIGATNVGRVLGRRFGILVFVLDFAKGALAVATARWIEPGQDLAWPGTLSTTAGLAAFLGHLFPIYLRFRGGKGVATGAGVVAVLLPGPTLGAFAAWLAVACATRYVSLASLTAAICLCGLRLWLTAEPFAPDNLSGTLFCFLAAGLVMVRHRANIIRLLNGTESQLTENLAMALFAKTIHVLAVGLWFGSGLFFTFVVALTIFHTFESLGTRPADERPAWFPDPFDKGKGTQLAGMAIGPIFPTYFTLQACCGLFALATALSWSRVQPRQMVHILRSIVLAVALLTVVMGRPLADKVSELRAERYSVDTVLAESARTAFGTWHLYSLLLNFVTLTLVTVAMVLAAQLPAEKREGSGASGVA